MYGLEGRMTMLSTADDSHFTSYSTNNVQPIHPPASPVLVASEVTNTATSGNGAESVSENCSKSLPGLLNSDPTETSPVYDARRRSANADKLEYRRSSGSKLSSSQDSADLAGSLRRASAQHRQLPDLPQIPGAQNIPRRSSSVLSHDGTSELYATVGETPIPDGSERPSKRSSHYAQIRENGSGKNAASVSSPAGSQAFVNGAPGSSSVAGSRANGNNGRGGIEATPSSDSETYASSHHPYAKLKKNAEHPYARVRSTATGENGNDEETDTDNYDLPQFLSRQVGPSSAAVPSSSSAARSSGANLNNAGGVASSVVGSSADAEGPVPPRRIGRQWRRSSQPQVLNNDNASHFSGDSQDSRGYTSISVREPLSNIRSQVASTRSYDSHYATVSDDSEEMYAAIDDPIDGNYMRIPGEDGNQPRRPNWLGGPCVASPIPERREANSPLPPVPNVPPPDLSPDGAAAPLLPSSSVPPPPSSSVPLPPSSSSVLPPASPVSQPNVSSTTLPVYAQVTKKSKKGKTPVTPTASNASTSSQQTREVTGNSQSIELPNNGPLFSATAIAKETTSTSHHHSHHHPSHHRSKRAASLMDNTNPMDADAVDSRRWSKADISYSEFEVVRESMFPGDERPSPSASSSRDITPVEPPAARKVPRNLVDEDNYNIIPDKSTAVRTSSSGKGPPRGRLDSGNYHEIDPPLNNTYQEIGGGKEPSDHYQEIGDRSNLVDDDGAELYQEIDRKGRDFDDEDEEEDDGDQFYERVKPSSQKGKKSGGSLGKKHGYEKIKRKGIPGNLSSVIPAIGSDEEEDDEDDDKPDQLYESVKYPPYERLKESKDDLADSHDEEGKNASDFYEDIGYSRVKPKPKTTSGSSKSPCTNNEEKPEVDEGDSIRSEVDVSQLYARVDKSKKRKGATNTVMPNADNNRQTGTTPSDISGNNNEPSSSVFKVEGDDHIGQLYSKVNKLAKSNKNSELRGNPSGGGGSSSGRGVAENETHRLDNDNSIEYI
ncbi:hypothetical protein Ocin01_01631 [Orchesella cincta]|uniref:Uncharacterized protein n=1 Tax=Orchesella cincta TaxID=48709 RepID=A0A1D2NJF8_ORCCI|nr:hypothetical protein Ocin01_01631 [Orchesella cincta]